ncbi:MAG: DNA polymerase III subunit delta' [Dongiaceae bacterium]
MARKPASAVVVEEPTGPVVATDLIGHEAAEQVFLKALERGRMPHAWLITGPRGVGKATLAYRMARRLLSETPPVAAAPEAETGLGLFGEEPVAARTPMHHLPADSLDMPADHPVFRRVVAQSHPDLRVLQRRVNEKTGKMRSEILIEDVREVIDFLHLKPAESEWRVVIIDAADDLNRNAANAILKMLEEPAARTVLILVSHAPGSLLPTIRSRCRRLQLSPLPEAMLHQALTERCPQADPADRDAAIILAAGSLGQGITLLEQNGLTVFRIVLASLAPWPNLNTGAIHQLADRLAGRGNEGEFEMAVTALDWWLKRLCRHLALTGGGGEAVSREFFPGEHALFARCQAAAGLDRWVELWEKLNRLFDRVVTVNLDRKQAWIAGCLAIEAVGR